MAAPSSPSRGHRRQLSTTNIALRSGSTASGLVHLAAGIWITMHFMAHSLAWTLAFALPIFMLSAISVYINLRKRELLAFSERKRTRTLILNLLLSLIWAVACAVTLFQGALVLTTLQTISSYKPLPLLVPAACGGLALFAGWNAIYAVLLALGPGEK